MLINKDNKFESNKSNFSLYAKTEKCIHKSLYAKTEKLGGGLKYVGVQVIACFEKKQKKKSYSTHQHTLENTFLLERILKFLIFRQ